MIRSIPKLLAAIETRIPTTKIPIGTKSSIGMLSIPTVLLDLRFAEGHPESKHRLLVGILYDANIYCNCNMAAARDGCFTFEPSIHYGYIIAPVSRRPFTGAMHDFY